MTDHIPDAVEKLVEAVARACCLDGEADYKNSDGVTFWEFYRDDAAAILAAIDATGWQIMPKVPTENMLRVIGTQREGYNSDDELYAAMLAAAPKVVP